MSKVTVVVTAYNEERYIERCIRSILNQSAKLDSYEIIIVDDGSSDRTLEIVSKFGNNIKLIRNEHNIGLPASINKGIEASNSRFYVRVDADDYVSEFFIEYLLFCIEQNIEYKAVACDYIEVDELEQHLVKKSSKEFPIGCGVIFNKQAVIDLGLYNPKFRAREEEELMKRFKESGHTVLNLPLPLYRYRKHEGRITNNMALMDTYGELLK